MTTQRVAESKINSGKLKLDKKHGNKKKKCGHRHPLTNLYQLYRSCQLLIAVLLFFANRNQWIYLFSECLCNIMWTVDVIICDVDRNGNEWPFSPPVQLDNL